MVSASFGILHACARLIFFLSLSLSRHFAASFCLHFCAHPPFLLSLKLPVSLSTAPGTHLNCRHGPRDRLRRFGGKHCRRLRYFACPVMRGLRRPFCTSRFPAACYGRLPFRFPCLGVVPEIRVSAVTLQRDRYCGALLRIQVTISVERAAAVSHPLVDLKLRSAVERTEDKSTGTAFRIVIKSHFELIELRIISLFVCIKPREWRQQNYVPKGRNVHMILLM